MCVCPMGWQPWVCIYSVQVKIMRNGNNISMLGASGAWAAGAGVKVYLLTCKPEVFTSHPVKSYINVSVLGFGCKVGSQQYVHIPCELGSRAASKTRPWWVRVMGWLEVQVKCLRADR